MAKSVWEMGPVVRGALIEARLGVNLAKNFPVIDKIGNMVATSIKSIDVTAKTYLDAARFEKKVQSYIDKIAAFNGARWAGRTIEFGKDFTSRALKLALDKGKLTDAQRAALKRLEGYAEKHDVKLDPTDVK